MSHLHMVSIYVPYPPDYGGAIDEFYRLASLKRAGIEVTLHCFLYGGRPQASELERYCDRVYYYRRSMAVTKVLGRTPFVARSRKDPQLLQNLLSDQDPILFEGAQTCAFIGAPSLSHRRKLVRMHNVEWRYYHHLAEHEPNPLKRFHFRMESAKLKAYESHVLRHAQCVLPISRVETAYFVSRHGRVRHLPPFHEFDRVVAATGTGTYVLVHGDFMILDNARAALAVATAADAERVPCVIAGKSPPDAIRRQLQALSNVRVHADASADVMLRLMQDAQMHVVCSENPSGFKIKLLNALFAARHVVVQRHIVQGEDLEMMTHVFGDSAELRALLRSLMHQPATEEDLRRREASLLPRFSNGVNARILIEEAFRPE